MAQSLNSAQIGNRWRGAMWSVAALLLSLPWVAMQLTKEVQWDAADFALFGGMLVAACGAYELAARLTGNRAYRAAVGVVVGAAFLVTWAHLAVGIFDGERQPANLPSNP
jgi:hypothetical protein